MVRSFAVCAVPHRSRGTASCWSRTIPYYSGIYRYVSGRRPIKKMYVYGTNILSIILASVQIHSPTNWIKACTCIFSSCRSFRPAVVGHGKWRMKHWKYTLLDPYPWNIGAVQAAEGVSRNVDEFPPPGADLGLLNVLGTYDINKKRYPWPVVSNKKHGQEQKTKRVEFKYDKKTKSLPSGSTSTAGRLAPVLLLHSRRMHLAQRSWQPSHANTHAYVPHQFPQFTNDNTKSNTKKH